MKEPPAGHAIHGVAFLIGDVGLLVTGPSGAGKSSFVLTVAALWRDDPVRLVADDRVRLSASGGRLVARPVEGFLGLIEMRGMGMAHHLAMPSAVLRGVVALGQDHTERMPPEAFETERLLGVALPRLGLRSGPDSPAGFIVKWPYFRAAIMQL
jgi:serine kinase of HPr protein (carbohydrate metabolism regulator)